MMMIASLVQAQPTFTTPFDRVPDFGAAPTIVAVQSGLWSQPSTWSQGRIPNATDVVGVTGYTVTYDSSNGIAQVVALSSGGWLTFKTTQTTRLTVGTLLVGPGGTLAVGTDTVPVAPGITAEIVIRDIPINTTTDPSQYGTGLLVIDGTLHMVGASKTPFQRLTHEVSAGSTILTTTQPAVGWRPGDILVVPDSRQLSDATSKTYVSQVETPRVSTVDGSIVTVAIGMAFSHPGARDSLTGNLDFTPHLGNLTRNVKIRSENPNGTRGHVWLTRKSAINIQYAGFHGLGRTTTAALNDTMYKNGIATHIGTNQVGRYTLHLHHLVHSTPFVLRGNVIHGGTAPHTRKWAITIHDSHYGLVSGNIMYNCAGACLMTEDGSESHNLIEDNLAVLATGTANRYGKGSEATGFWFRGPNNTVRRNVAASIRGGSHNTPHNGYSIWMTDVAMAKIPLYSGADTTVPGQYTVTNLHSIPLREFVDNEAYAVNVGMTAWWLGTQYHTPKATEDSVVKGLKAWNVWSYGWYGYHTHRMVIDSMVTRGSAQGIGCCNAAYAGNDYFTSDFTIRNSDLQGTLDGVVFSTYSSGYQRLENTRVIPSRYGIQMQTLALTGLSGQGLPPRHVTAENLRISKPPGSIPGWKSIHFAYSALTGPRNMIQEDTIGVTSYQGVSGADFQAYYLQQAPEFIVPQSVPNTNGSPRFIGAPVAGLTNTQALAEYGVAIAGGIAPCRDTTTYPEISGYACKGVHK